MFKDLPKRRGKKNKLEEVDKPRGLARELELDAIVGTSGPNLWFLVKWIGCNELDLVSAPELNAAYPDRVIEYYEARSTIFRKFRNRQRVTALLNEPLGMDDEPEEFSANISEVREEVNELNEESITQNVEEPQIIDENLQNVDESLNNVEEMPQPETIDEEQPQNLEEAPAVMEEQQNIDEVPQENVMDESQNVITEELPEPETTQMQHTFRVLNKELVHWFPGHMGKGLKQMQQKLKNVDCIIEVHDARIPFSGRNEEFKYTISGIRPNILVFNKKDLIDRSYQNAIKDRLINEENMSNVIFTNCKDQRCGGIRKVLPLTKTLIAESNRYNRSENPELTVMIIGVPNVGKSSLINILRNRHLNKRSATAVGAVAGITRSVLNRIKISEDPPIFLIDTPGILEPKVKDIESGLKLALCGCLQDHLVGNDVIADYLLFRMNKEENFDYVPLLGLKEPCDEIVKVLTEGATHLNKFKKIKSYDGSIKMIPDMDYAAIYLLKTFRQGLLGKAMLDKV